jgi:hypothetical protein
MCMNQMYRVPDISNEDFTEDEIEEMPSDDPVSPVMVST